MQDKQVLDFESPAGSGHASVTKEKLGGIVVDDSEAQLTGFEAHGASAGPYVGDGYSHDGNKDKGKQKAVFKTKLPEGGSYEVRFAYTALNNRATNVPVTVKSADGEKTITVNEKETPPIDGFLLSLGVFRFEAGSDAIVEISNEGTDGHVIVDAVQWLKK